MNKKRMHSLSAGHGLIGGWAQKPSTGGQIVEPKPASSCLGGGGIHTKSDLVHRGGGQSIEVARPANVESEVTDNPFDAMCQT